MANFRGAAYLASALESVLSQTVRNLEIIVFDDASPDESIGIVRGFMARDPRIRLIVVEANAGPAAARNRALETARGEWIAVVDSDDIVHPERFEILIAAANRLNADAIADDLLFFSDSGRGSTLLGDIAGRDARLVSAADFIRSNTSGNRLPPLGYLKPLIKRAAVAGHFYDEAVRIGEDYDFLLRFLLAGGRLFVLPELLYLYRRHSQSISHRLSEDTVLAMIANQDALLAKHPALPQEIADLLARRMKALQRSLSFERLVLSLKRRRAADAVGLLAANPHLAIPLARSMAENLQSRFKRTRAPEAAARAIALHGPGELPSGARVLHAALGLAQNAEPVPVPPYQTCADRRPAGEQTRMLRVRLAEADLEVVCHGLAGLYAAGFLPRKRIAGVAVDDGRELARMMDWMRASPAPLLISDGALETASPAPEVDPFCPGYHLVRNVGQGNVEAERAASAQA